MDFLSFGIFVRLFGLSDLIITRFARLMMKEGFLSGVRLIEDGVGDSGELIIMLVMLIIKFVMVVKPVKVIMVILIIILII
jgi:hypothetical protein